MTLEQKVGQLFFIGIGGVGFDASTRAIVEDIKPGGICLFSRNIRTSEQTRELLDSLRENSTVEPFLSLDQEGGLVDRLRKLITPMPSASKIKTPEQASELAAIIAETVRILGFNMNFAPVVDVIDEMRESVSNGLHSRAFGHSTLDVVQLAGAFLSEMQRNGCLGCIKHFPGLGAASVDAHEELPQVALSDAVLEEVDLVPYRRLIANGSAKAVMIGHAAYPQFRLQETGQDGKLLPSSLSFRIVTELLRNELAFDGLVVTDDLEMGAIVRNFGIGEACVRSIEAGNDMVAICADAHRIREGHAAIFDAVDSGRITHDRLNRSVERIARTKGLLSSPLPFDQLRLEQLSSRVADLNKKLT